MILFLGTRQGKKTIKHLKEVPCPHCKQTDTLKLSSCERYFHIFWIPLIKLGIQAQAECSHCKRVYYKEEFSEGILKEL